MSWLAGARERLRTLLFRAREEVEMADEIRFHLEMEAERLVREEGLEPAEARRRAAVSFGGVERFKEEVRDARGLAWLSGLSLDVKLGVRMLGKYPWLALVGGVGMAVAIAVGTGMFVFLYSFMLPVLPIDEGERVVAFENWDLAVGNNERPWAHDLVRWREELRSVEEVGGFRGLTRNLIVEGGSAEPVHLTEMSASGFRVARVAPLLGRPLLEEDERPGAPNVLVIGYDAWRERFASDPGVVGREVRLGAVPYTIVGVMPEGFAFPVNDSYWTPLRIDASAYPEGEGPTLTVFARLAPGFTLEGAQAELEAVGRRTAAALPTTHGQVRPRVIPYVSGFADGVARSEAHLIQLMVSLLLVVVAVNVAVLVYARTAMRQGEIAVRTALGASRGRIVAQLFAEAFVLCAAAGVLGLALAAAAMRLAEGAIAGFAGGVGESLPFWMTFRLSWGAALYVLGLALLGALIVGVVPALQATGRGLQDRLRSMGGGTGLQLGRTWTALIVAQVAFAVAMLPIAAYTGWDFAREGLAAAPPLTDRFLLAPVSIDPDRPPSGDPEADSRATADRFRERFAELTARLAADGAVSHVTFSRHYPGGEGVVWVEVEGLATPAQPIGGHGVVEGRAGHQVLSNRVDPGLFAAFDAPILLGRGFEAGDLGEAADAAVVSRGFAEGVLGGANPVGRHFRYVGRGGDAYPNDVSFDRWYEIVGVVEDFVVPPASTGSAQGRIYHPIAPGGAIPLMLAVRARSGDPAALAPRLRALSTDVDPNLRFGSILPLDERLAVQDRVMRLSALGFGIVTTSVLLLSAAGIYAMMSFTVTRRRREIGIRSALGADSRRILLSVFSRVAWQIAAGVAVGLLFAPFLLQVDDPMNRAKGIALAAIVAAVMGIALLSAVGPARRGLRVPPMEALRAE